MSLINEALKRAQAEKSGTPLPDPVFLDSQAGAGMGRSRAASRVAGLLLAVALLGGGLLTWRLLGVAKQPTVPAGASAGVAAPGESPSPARLTASAVPATGQSASAPPVPAAPPDAGEKCPLPEESVAAAEETAAAPPSPLGSEKPAGPPPPAAPQAAPAPQAPKPAAPAFDPSRYKLGGVVLGEEGETAILNGRLVQVGDTVDGAKVVKIAAKAVHLEIAGQVHVVRP
jgi:hypothetical protein